MTHAMTKGSLSDLAAQHGGSLAEAFLSADTIILVDTSGSMASRDGDTQTRYDRACAELAQLQANLAGRIAVMAFSTDVKFCPGGVPHYYGLGTDMVKALEFVRPADGLVDRLILISDGEPDQALATLALAAKFETQIDCIFIGPEVSPGADFLRRLAKASGGTSQAIAQASLLSERIERLMLAGAA